MIGVTRTSLAMDLVTEGDLTLADIEDVPKTVTPVQVPSLTPPQALFQPIEYPPLHIFVSILVLTYCISSGIRQSFFPSKTIPKI